MKRRRLLTIGSHVVLATVAIMGASVTLSAPSDAVTLSSASQQSLAYAGISLSQFTGGQGVSRQAAMRSVLRRNPSLHIVDDTLADATVYDVECSGASIIRRPYWVLLISSVRMTRSVDQIDDDHLFVDLVDPRTGRLMYQRIWGGNYCGY